MPKTISLLLISTIIIGACNSEKNEKQLRAVIAGFKNANENVQERSLHYFYSLRERTLDPTADQIAQPLFKKAEAVLQLTTQARVYIEILKSKGSAPDSPYQIFDTLFTCRKAMLRLIEPDNRQLLKFRKKEIETLNRSLPLFAGLTDTTEAAINLYRKNWTDSNVVNSGIVMNQVMLCKLENDLLITTQKLLEYCHNSMTYHRGCFDYLPIATISSSYVKAGDSIEVNVGVATFDVSMRPKISIDGYPIVLNREAVAVYTVKAKGKSGKRSIPVQVEYSKPDGAIQLVRKNLTYTVLE